MHSGRARDSAYMGRDGAGEGGKWEEEEIMSWARTCGIGRRGNAYGITVMMCMFARVTLDLSCSLRNLSCTGAAELLNKSR